MLSVKDRQVISWIEVYYHENHSFPSYPTIISEWPKTFPTDTSVETWLASPIVRQAFDNRGLPCRPSSSLKSSSSNSYNAGSSNDTNLTEMQASAILVVANLTDRRSTTAKLKSMGISLAQWNAWKKTAKFKNFLHKQLTEDFDTSLDRALGGLLKAVDNGNPRAIELYLELTGRQPTENERNYKLAVSRIVECVTRHVKDPLVLRQIAEDFKKIEQGLDPSQTINETQWIEATI